jgi:hypothetical protein
MAKPKDRKKSADLWERVLERAAVGRRVNGPERIGINLPNGERAQPQPTADTSKLPRLKKFRFQLLYHWLSHNLAPCRVADIGGGKGVLAYLLQQGGWEATVIDPTSQALLHKHKEVNTGRRVFLPAEAAVTRIDAPFQPEMAQDFDLLIGLHSHACNIKIIDAATTYGAGFLLMPCCIIDEPLYPLKGISWVECLADYAIRQGHLIYPLRLNFKGENIGFYALGQAGRVAFAHAS